MKRGFTLVEMVITILLLALLGVMLGNRIVNSNNKSKERLYNAKIEVALSAAKKYGYDHLDDLSSTTCEDIDIRRLITLEYLESDDNSAYEFKNPIDNSSLTSTIICIKYIGGAVEATLK